MPLSLPNLDDRRYGDLVEEARALIPSYAPEWTNHNPSDPGVTLVELFAYLTEMLVYRVNRVTDENVRAFVKLIAGERANPARPLGDEIRDAVLGLRSTVRAVTAEDYESLAVAAKQGEVARALCLPLRNLEAEKPFAAASEGHVSVAVVPAKAKPGSDEAKAILAAVRQDLEPRKLLTTRLHVVEPRYVTLRLKTVPGAQQGEVVKTTLVLKPGAKERTEQGESGEQKGVVDLAVEALREFFDPLRGGPDRRGWPFGRSVYVSEVYALLNELPGVDYVTNLMLDLTVPPRAGAKAAGDESAARVKRVKTGDGKEGEVYAFELEPDELVNAQVSADDIAAKRAALAPKYDLK